MGALREVWAEEWCDLASVLRRTSDCCIQKRPRRAEWLVRMLWGSCRWEMVVIWAGEGSVEVVRKDFHSGWIKEMAGEVVLGPFIRPAAEFPLAYGPAGWFIQTASALASLWVWPRAASAEDQKAGWAWGQRIVLPASSLPPLPLWVDCDCLPAATALPYSCALWIPGNFALPSLLPSHLGVMPAPIVASSRVHQ